MKKILTAALLACVFALPVFAEDKLYKTVRVGLDIVYTMPAMEQVNSQLNDGGSDVAAINAGVAGMLDFEVALAPFIMAGVRGGYVYCFPGSASYLFDTIQQTVNAALIPVEIGLSTNFDLASTPISIMAGIYGGYGFALASFNNNFDILGVTGEYTQPYDGAGFIGEFMASINYKMESGLSVNINGGYRLAKIMQLKQSSEVTYTDSLTINHTVGEKGDVLKDSDNNDLAFDYSGFNVGLGISMGF